MSVPDLTYDNNQCHRIWSCHQEMLVFWKGIPPPLPQPHSKCHLPAPSQPQQGKRYQLHNLVTRGLGGGLESSLCHGSGGMSLLALAPGLLPTLSTQSELSESGSPLNLRAWSSNLLHWNQKSDLEEPMNAYHCLTLFPDAAFPIGIPDSRSVRCSSINKCSPQTPLITKEDTHQFFEKGKQIL